MTDVRLIFSEGRAIRGFEISGHAGAGEEGYDLVCAAISFLAVTCANALETVAMTRPEVTQHEGYLKAVLKESQLNPEASVILRLFRQGVLDLQGSYPDNVRLIHQVQ